MNPTLYKKAYLKQVENEENADIISFLLTSLFSSEQGNVKKLIKIVNIEEENSQIF